MAKRKQKQDEEQPTYRSAAGPVGGAVTLANDLDKAGYTILYCFPVVLHDAEGIAIQGIYFLGKRNVKET